MVPSNNEIYHCSFVAHALEYRPDLSGTIKGKQLQSFDWSTGSFPSCYVWLVSMVSFTVLRSSDGFYGRVRCVLCLQGNSSATGGSTSCNGLIVPTCATSKLNINNQK